MTVGRVVAVMARHLLQVTREGESVSATLGRSESGGEAAMGEDQQRCEANKREVKEET